MRHESDITDNRTGPERIAAELADLRRDVDYIARTQAEIIELLRQPARGEKTITAVEALELVGAADRAGWVL